MSIYTLMSTQVPTVAYCIMHQEAANRPKEEFLKKVKERHGRLRAETHALEVALRKLLSDTTAKEVQTLRGMLSPFLQTPISSDDAEVRRILREAFDRYMDQVLDGAQTGITYATAGKISFPALKKVREKTLLSNGKLYLEELGFNVSRDKGELLETIFVLQGAKNLDVLEYLLHEKLSADMLMEDAAGPGRFVRTIHNLMFAKGDMVRKSSSENVVETSISFSRPELKYASFRQGLFEGLEKLHEKFMPDHISLWQQKLGLGAGKEFVLRVIGRGVENSIESILWLESLKERAFLKHDIIERGSLLIKELIV